MAARWVCRYLLHLHSYPYSFYFMPHHLDGQDFMIFYPRFEHFHSAEFFITRHHEPVFAYPAAVSPFYWLFYHFPHAQITFLLVSVCIVLLPALLLFRLLKQHGLPGSGAAWLLAVAAVCSFPFYAEFNRANMEIIMWMFTVAGVLLILRVRPWLGATCLAVATAMKMYPFVFVGLLIARKQYRQAVYLVAAAGLINLVSLWLLCPDIHQASAGLTAGVTGVQMLYGANFSPIAIGMDHSLYALIKRMFWALFGPFSARSLSIYVAVSAVSGTALYFLRIRRLPVINQVLALTVASVLLPPVSFEYTLMHLYIPWAMLAIFAVDAWRSGKANVPGLWAVFVCFALILSQLGQIILHGERLGGQIKAGALLVLFILALRFPFSSWLDEPEPRTEEAFPSEAEPFHSSRAPRLETARQLS